MRVATTPSHSYPGFLINFFVDEKTALEVIRYVHLHARDYPNPGVQYWLIFSQKLFERISHHCDEKFGLTFSLKGEVMMQKMQNARFELLKLFPSRS